MDILTSLDRKSDYTKNQLEVILGAWVMSALVEKRGKISTHDGDVSEDDYDKTSIYSLLYSLYRSVGDVRSASGETYELTFNTWGYAWPEGAGACPTAANDPQRFGKNAYTGLFAFPEVEAYVAARAGRVHVVELGCGTGAGAHHVASKVLPHCTYEAVDMQRAAIETCKRKFVPELGGRLRATCADATSLGTADGVADLVAINETHVTELTGRATEEDRRFFQTVVRLLKPGGFLVWGNAIPEPTWEPCFEVLESLGMKKLAVRDVTAEAVAARDQDKGRVDAYVDQAIAKFLAFRLPVVGAQRRREAEQAMKNFYRNPGTRLYENMVDGTDTYKVVLFQKPALH
ncbi:MAG TPA: class I SAM-dependent methyltransferase [Polyangiaceae bacterium]|nr:class I SAM-dependent methyltransferase [Polyangiaceae bacterium]